MTVNLKTLKEQVIVITGVSSGIGLTTARMASARGAKLVLVSRNAEALRKLSGEINSTGEAIYVVADVGSEGDIDRVAGEAIGRFGRFDTWVNNAGVSIYGDLEDVSTTDMRQLFETNFWGTVYGSLVAAKNMKASGGGAIINIGSTLSDRAIPLQGIYCASKHAVKGFTDALRMELEANDAPISVSLIKPSAIDTPYKEHAKNYLTIQPENPPPVYAPETVAEAILHCAENPVRDVFVGGGGKALSVMGNYAPRLTDQVMETTMMGQTRSGEPAGDSSLVGLYESNDSRLSERGTYEGHVLETSLYTKASLHPMLTGALALGAAGLAYTFYAKRNSRSH